MHGHIEIPGFKILSCLWRSAGRAAFRASRQSDNCSVLIETLDSDYPDRLQVAALQREASIAAQLDDVVGVRKVRQVISFGSGNVGLISDDYDRSLASLLARAPEGQLATLNALEIAHTLAEILGDIHARGIVHKALGPNNVLINTERNAFALSGFSIASELGQERQGTEYSLHTRSLLPYASPEQTGRMNRSLDYRSDLYSLGILLYELLAGELPFKAETTLDWVHQHISRVAPDLSKKVPTVPRPVSDIVLKLLAKSPDDRYQSSQGLLHDLNRCIASLKQGKSPNAFALGEQDQRQQFLTSQSLYGRESELVKLLSLFDEAVAGQTRLCLVHGYSGVGKSALVNELDQHQIRERGFLVQSKFDQFQRSEAYSALAETFRGLVQQILLEPEDRLSQWRDRLQGALGPNGALVTDMVPELTLIIGEQPPIASLPPAESRNRLQLLLTAFLRAFATEDHPVVLFLDDLQWSDQPTIDLIRRIAMSREQSHLLLIGAYRSNEVGPGHPLRLLLDDLEGQPVLFDIALKPLCQKSVGHLVADTLRRPAEDVEPLSELLYQKAKGNPFFTNELLRHLHAQRAIWPDPSTGQWQWQLDEASWEKASGDVVTFMLDGLRQLPAPTQHVLQLAACIGNTFQLRTLATIYEHSVAETALALLPALKQYTVLPLHGDYRLASHSNESVSINPRYRFQHDRVQQAAYNLIDESDLPAMHLTVGRLMQQDEGGEVSNEHLIDIVNHLNQGRSLIQQTDELQQLAELNLRAGIRARESSAYRQAQAYLALAEEVMPKRAWQSAPELVDSLTTEMQLAHYLNGHTEQADLWLARMFERADSDLARADVLAVRTRQNATQGRMAESIEAAIEGLALLGIDFARNPTQSDVDAEREQVRRLLGDRKIEQLVEAPTIEDPATLAAMRLLMEIFAAAFLSGSQLFSYLVLKSVNLALARGNSPEAAFAYAAYGMLLCGELDQPAEGYQFARVGLAINERLDDISLRARVIYVYAMFVHHWTHHWSTLTAWFRKGIEAGYQSGDLLYLAYSAQDCVIWDPGLDLETAATLHRENLEIVRECAYQDSLDSGTLFLQMQRNMLGDTLSAHSLSSSDFDEDECLRQMRDRGFLTGLANHYIYNAEVNLLHGSLERALHNVRKQDELIRSAMSLPQLTRFYLVANLTLTSVFPTMTPEEQASTRSRLEQDLARMTLWADNCEANFRHLQHLMTAELARLDNQPEKALALYDQAIDGARKHGFLRDEATAYERAARLLIHCGRPRSAEGYLRGAYGLFKRWGAHRKVLQLEAEFPVLHELHPASALAGSGNAGDLDLESVMRASREISGEMVLEQLLEKTLAILLQNAGAQWGCVIVREQGQCVIESCILPEDKQPAGSIPGHLVLCDRDGNGIPVPMSVISQVFTTNKAIVLNSAQQDERFSNDPYVRNLKPRSILCVPIHRDRLEAAVYMENNLADGVFTEERVEVIQLLAAQASVAIENARLYEQVQEYTLLLEDKVAERTAELEALNEELQRLADRDGLTGVANRRSGDAYLQDTWLRLRRQRQPLSVIMLDVDHFKAYNDNYGHQRGDICLTEVAGALKNEMNRSSDMVARYGGEEFLLILPNTDSDGAARVAENVRLAVERLGIEHAHSSVGEFVTVSVGCAAAVPDDDTSIEEVVYQADLALYRAKQTGRNRVEVAR
ncbi:diguanylate cyclase [Marinobacter halotolerans]|uniref:diguanylate cyclase n=1 Tax=Marinobacter halotolerans TaxID=1569211 RepID=UPI001244263E|nr:diguanylate cyclase [Marinobacter halotolerans]